jgi:hypothetical protein
VTVTTSEDQIALLLLLRVRLHEMQHDVLKLVDVILRSTRTKNIYVSHVASGESICKGIR